MTETSTITAIRKIDDSAGIFLFQTTIELNRFEKSRLRTGELFKVQDWPAEMPARRLGRLV